jgi:hypothetical protein
MLILKYVIVLGLTGLAGLCLSGCKRGDAPSPVPSAPVQPAPAAASGGLLKTQRDALNSAQALEGQLQQQARDRETAIDAAQK